MEKRYKRIFCKKPNIALKNNLKRNTIKRYKNIRNWKMGKYVLSKKWKNVKIHIHLFWDVIFCRNQRK